MLIPGTIHSTMKCINHEMCSLLLSTPKKFAHKGTKGNALLISGCASMPGATILASNAAMRGGLGKLTVHAPQSVLKSIAVTVPELVKQLGNPILTTSVHDDDDVIEYTTDPELIHEKYESEVDVVIDGGYGETVASTIVDCTTDAFEIIRQGKGELSL
jgi:NAD(P)H-hydrate repair Nnr-like enzyme with NAD(P)H-hydrate dehydratase domain